MGGQHVFGVYVTPSALKARALELNCFGYCCSQCSSSLFDPGRNLVEIFMLNIFYVFFAVAWTPASQKGFPYHLIWDTLCGFEPFDHYPWRACWLLMLSCHFGLWKSRKTVFADSPILTHIMVPGISWPTEGTISWSIDDGSRRGEAGKCSLYSSVVLPLHRIQVMINLSSDSALWCWGMTSSGK